ncbi:MAG: hypothetical protein ACUVRZ_00825 [Desulfobacca sp.]|uniref:hypothetical protein n=1 Tax=Desulfobacca sp. TaxID=2067990 RepID=UPI00404B9876
MEQIAQIAAAMYERVSQVPEIAQVEFCHHVATNDLQRLTRTPLLLISPHLMESVRLRLSSDKHLLLDTYLISRNRRGAGDAPGVLELLKILDNLDAALVNQTLGLAIQPITVWRREPLALTGGGETSVAVVRTIYRAVLCNRLAQSRFIYTDSSGRQETIDFELVAGSGQGERLEDNNDYARSLAGTLRSYRRPAKRQAKVQFILIPTALKDRLRQMKEAATEIVYFREKEAGVAITCGWVNDFDFVEERPGFWSGVVLLQEI